MGCYVECVRAIKYWMFAYTVLFSHNTAPFRIIRASTPYMRDAAKQELDEGKTQEHRAIVNVISIILFFIMYITTSRSLLLLVSMVCYV